MSVGKVGKLFMKTLHYQHFARNFVQVQAVLRERHSRLVHHSAQCYCKKPSADELTEHIDQKQNLSVSANPDEKPNPVLACIFADDDGENFVVDDVNLYKTEIFSDVMEDFTLVEAQSTDDNDKNEKLTFDSVENSEIVLNKNAELEISNSNLTEFERDIDVELSAEDLAVLEVTGVPKKSSVPVLSNTFAPHVNNSNVLKYLISLNVDLSKVAEKKGLANKWVRMDIEKDVLPVISFLVDLGIQEEDLGHMITKNPWIFDQNVDDIKVRINYLESKKFTRESIINIVSSQPRLLNLPTASLDGRLGYYQKNFNLTGNQVRVMVDKCPKIVNFDTRHIERIRMQLKLVYQFNDEQMKKILLGHPHVYLSYLKRLDDNFQYALVELGFTLDFIADNPRLLDAHIMRVKERVGYLKHIGRDQFDPTKENFVNIQFVDIGSDIDFVEKYCNKPYSEYTKYLKTQ